eukprot:CAMPEP_0168385122 /NCGR_PEP_ID=MMETSP0228-20121227/14761_1 /TAXON_ID=133427 /ORGANISM="Protoceratium reticulatum, Strain CCCM 535 (=CCMP 1889)" /LENGTH=118 /DNA_ID=CAMNT_0008398305 /DNA_START=84 /DNA_END=436 /DNA_ORIENTATION=+
MEAVMRSMCVACMLFAPAGATKTTAWTSTFARTLRSQVISGAFLKAQPESEAIARTIQTLDRNRDGRVDPSEVTAFALTQGLDSKAAEQEFSLLDANGDGTLDTAEIASALVPGAAAP